MKIITGSLRGRNLAALDGLTTRPTTARIKESIFNIIQFDIEGREVLDVFAGSGQMGLEAISRGAKGCTFCETDRKAFGILSDNLALCKVNNARAHQRDGVTHIKSLAKNSVGLVFLDPPYNTNLLQDALAAIFEFDILLENGIIVCESSLDYVLGEIPPPYVLLKEYHYGKTKITTITKNI